MYRGHTSPRHVFSSHLCPLLTCDEHVHMMRFGGTRTSAPPQFTLDRRKLIPTINNEAAIFYRPAIFASSPYPTSPLSWSWTTRWEWDWECDGDCCQPRTAKKMHSFFFLHLFPFPGKIAEEAKDVAAYFNLFVCLFVNYGCSNLRSIDEWIARLIDR